MSSLTTIDVLWIAEFQIPQEARSIVDCKQSLFLENRGEEQPRFQGGKFPGAVR